jgi:hypothetical protein
MTWTIAKIAVAGALTAIPLAAVGIPVCGAQTSGSTPIVLPAPLPADPQIEPEPPAPSHGEYYNPDDYNDWYNSYNAGADGGGGGGGGG